MKNEKLGRMLRYYRTLRNYSIQTVSERLREANMPAAVKTIYSWEAGRTEPDADRLMFLCKLYEIDDILAAFGYNTKKSKKNKVEQGSLLLTDSEKRLILAYREHPELQAAIHKLLELE